MKRKAAVAVVTGVVVVGFALPAAAAEQHPPKFGVGSTQCTGTNNQPNCPGSH